MSSKPGYLKTTKQMSDIGSVLQNIGQTGYNIMNTGAVKMGAGMVGQAIGSVAIPIPIVGGMIGKAAGKLIADDLKYNFGTIGEIGKSIKDLQNGSSLGQEIKDVLSYESKQRYNDFMNSNLMKVIKGDMNWRDGIINEMENFTGVNWMTDKTHAWKDKQGNYHKEYVDGAKMVVGKWEQPTNVMPKPDLQSNSCILGVHNGEIYYKGFDDARWQQLQQQGKVK